MRSVKFQKQIYRFLLLLFLFSISTFLYYIFFHLKISQSFHQPSGQQHGQQLSFSDIVLVKLKKEEEIPRIVHQAYSSRNLPLKYAAWQKSCIDLHPNWEFKLWTDQDLDDLVQNEYPWLLERYTGFTNWVNRVDLARYMILYKYGGFFIDLDIECLDSLERFAKMGGAVFPRMSFNTSTAIAFWEYNFPNSFLGSIPGHDIWKDAMFLISNSKKQGVERLTGSIFIYDLIHRYRDIELDSADESLPEIHILDPDLIFPYDWREETELSHFCAFSSTLFNTKKCKELIYAREKRRGFRKSYTVTYWTKMWQLDYMRKELDSPFLNN